MAAAGALMKVMGPKTALIPFVQVILTLSNRTLVIYLLSNELIPVYNIIMVFI